MSSTRTAPLGAFGKGLAATVVAAALLFGGRAEAGPIDPGFDLFETDPLSTVIDVAPFLSLPGPIPLNLEGQPIPGLGSTDTIVERKQGPNVPNPGDSDTIDIELVALQLRSVAPIDVSGTLFDVFVVGGTSNGFASAGQMTVTRTSAQGGTFEATITIDIGVTAIEVGNPLNQLFTPLNNQTFQYGGFWSETPGPNDPRLVKHLGAEFPAGGFFPGIDPGSGDRVLITGSGPFATYGAFAAVPEPATAASLAVGLIGLGWLRRRRQSTA